MKVGDKVLCIKNRSNFNLKNHIYTIMDIDYNKNVIKVSMEKNIYHIVCHYRYNVTADSDYLETYVFDEYFISLKKERKLKLKKINEKK